MLKNLKILTVFSIMMIGSGCATHVASPFCPPDRPELIDISNQEKFDMYNAAPSALEALALNDERLKSHIRLLEAIAVEHNKQFKAECL